MRFNANKEQYSNFFHMSDVFRTGVGGNKVPVKWCDEDLPFFNAPPPSAPKHWAMPNHDSRCSETWDFLAIRISAIEFLHLHFLFPPAESSTLIF